MDISDQNPKGAVLDLNGKRCLVTGGGGFIGSHLVEHLVSLGAETRAFVHYNSAGTAGWLDSSPCLDKVEVLFGDVTDRGSVLPAMEKVDYVFHLAALIAIPYSYRAAESYLRTNVLGTHNIMQLARELGVRRVVHTSTSEVYGTALSVPIAEDHPLQGQSPYSASKIGADKIAEAMHLSHGVPLVTVRPFNTFGPRQSARAVIPTIITQCLSGHARLRLGSLTPTRDLNYVSDTVRGFALAATAVQAEGQTVNLGSSREISIGSLAEMIAGLCNVKIRIEQADERMRPNTSEVERLLADNRKADQLLNWRPEVSLEDGLLRTIEWFRSHLARYRPDVYAI